MSPIRDFAVNLARGGHTYHEILEELEKTFGEKPMGKTQIYQIIKECQTREDMGDRRGENAKKRVRTMENIDAVRAVLKVDRCSKYLKIEEETGLSSGTIHRILDQDLGLVKKSARWVPKLLSSEQKAARVKSSEDFLRRHHANSGFLDSIITMDESAVSFYTPETKAKSKQWLPRGVPGPIKARIHASRRKQMVMAFF